MQCSVATLLRKRTVNSIYQLLNILAWTAKPIEKRHPDASKGPCVPWCTVCTRHSVRHCKLNVTKGVKLNRVRTDNAKLLCCRSLVRYTHTHTERESERVYRLTHTQTDMHAHWHKHKHTHIHTEEMTVANGVCVIASLSLSPIFSLTLVFSHPNVTQTITARNRNRWSWSSSENQIQSRAYICKLCKRHWSETVKWNKKFLPNWKLLDC